MKSNIFPILFLILGTTLSLYGIYILPIWHDEAITLLQLAGNATPKWPADATTVGDFQQLFHGNPGFSDINQMLIKTDVHPPLYYYAVKIWGSILGYEVTTIRLFSLVCAVLAAVLAIKLIPSEERAGRALAAFVLSLSPTFAYAAINARDYSLSILLCTGVVYCVQKALDNDQSGARTTKEIFLASVLAGLAFLTHYFTIMLTLPALLTLTRFTFRRNKFAHLSGSLIIVVSFIAAMPFLQSQLGAREDQYAGFDGWGSSILSAAKGIAAQITTAVQHLPASVTWPFFVLSAIALAPAIIAMFHLRRQRQAFLHTMCLFGFMIGITILFWLTDKSLSAAGPRYIVFALPSLLYLVGRGLHAIVKIENFLSRFATLGICASFVFLTAFPRVDGIGPYVQPWDMLRGDRLSKEAIEKYGAESAVFIAVTNSRGVVGEVVYELDAAIEARNVTRRDQIERAFTIPDNKDIVFISADARSKFLDEVKEKIDDLKAQGFERKAARLWVRETQ